MRILRGLGLSPGVSMKRGYLPLCGGGRSDVVPTPKPRVFTQVSAEIYELVKEEVTLYPRGEVEVKGKGTVATYITPFAVYSATGPSESMASVRTEDCSGIPHTSSLWPPPSSSLQPHSSEDDFATLPRGVSAVLNAITSKSVLSLLQDSDKTPDTGDEAHSHDIHAQDPRGSCVSPWMTVSGDGFSPSSGDEASMSRVMGSKMRLCTL